MVCVPDDIEPKHRRVAAIWLQQRRQDADGRRLSRAVGSEQTKHRAFVDGQIEPVQCSNLVLASAINLHESFGDNDRSPAARLPLHR